MIILGIDPGLSGAVAIIYHNGELQVIDTPTAVVKGTKRDYLTGDMMRILAGAIPHNAGLATKGALMFAVLEKGIAMPRQSSSTTYVTGRGGGLWEGLLAGLSIPYRLIEPVKWKRAMGIPPGSDKGASRVLAQRTFPQAASVFSRVKDDGRAEAALMAEWLRRQEAN